MTRYLLTCDLETATPIDETFRVFEDPMNLALITPKWLGFEVLTPDPVMRKGLLIDYRFRWLGLPLRWRTLISRYEPPYAFVDEMLQGPYRLWHHTHTFFPSKEGTMVRDEVRYALPLGFMGKVAHTLAVEKQLKKIFSYRQTVLADMLGAPKGWEPPAVRAL